MPDDRAGAPQPVRATQPGTLAAQQRDLARARILQAARRALAARGLATTVEEVADAAGVSRRTVFRHFSTRERLFAAAIRDGLRTYAEQLPLGPGTATGDLSDWLVDLLLAMHHINARIGRIYWELTALEPELTGELADAAAARRQARKRFALYVANQLWRARGGRGAPPAWLSDTVAVHLSGFTTQSLATDYERSPDEVARYSARVIEAVLAAALAEEPAAPDTGS